MARVERLVLELAQSDVDVAGWARAVAEVFRPALERLFASLVMVDHSPTQMGAP